MIGHSSASTRRLCGLVLVALLVTLAVAACGTPSGEELVEEKCTGCHTIKIIQVSNKPAHEWFNTVYRMKRIGADVDDSEVDAIVDYLTNNYGPTSSGP